MIHFLPTEDVKISDHFISVFVRISIVANLLHYGQSYNKTLIIVRIKIIL